MAGMMSPQLRQQIDPNAPPQPDQAAQADPNQPAPAQPSADPATPDAGADVGADDQGGGGQSDTVGPDDGQEQASPEEQAQKDAVVNAALELMYKDGKVNPVILKLLDNDASDLKQLFGDSLPLDEPDPQNPSGGTLWESQGPVIALAATAAVVLLETIKQMGDNMPEGYILLHAGSEILEDLAHLSQVSGKHDYSEQEMTEAMRKGADLFREAAHDAGLIDMDVAKQEFDTIVQADKAGDIGKVIPQFGKGADNGGVRPSAG